MVNFYENLVNAILSLGKTIGAGLTKLEKGPISHFFFFIFLISIDIIVTKNSNINTLETILTLITPFSLKTSLSKSTSYNIIKRFSQGGGKKVTEKVVKEVAKGEGKLPSPFGNVTTQLSSRFSSSLSKSSASTSPQKLSLSPTLNNKGNEIKEVNKPFLGLKDTPSYKQLVAENSALGIKVTSSIPESNIPLPPTLPPKPLIKPIKKIDVDSISTELLQKAKDNLKCKYNIPKNTKITENTKFNEITEDEIIVEAYLRGLIKIDDKPIKKENFDTMDNESINKVISKYSVKFTSLGQAHLKETERTTYVKHEINIYNEKDYEYKLGIINTEYNPNAIISSSRESHIVAVVIVNKNNNDTYIMGILTSKKTGEEVSPIQYYDFQKQKEKNYKEAQTQKPQMYQGSKNFEKVDKDKINFLKWSKEYIDYSNLRDILPSQHNKLQANIGKIFEGGYTKNSIINICINFDNKIKNKEPQPKTNEKLLQEAKGIEKQKKLNEDKQLEKQNNNYNNYEEF